MPTITPTSAEMGQPIVSMVINGNVQAITLNAPWTPSDLATALSGAGHASTAAGSVITVPASLTALELTEHRQEYLEDFEDGSVGRTADSRVGSSYAFQPGTNAFYTGGYAVGSANVGGGLEHRFWYQSLPGYTNAGGGVDGSGNPTGRYLCFDASPDPGIFFEEPAISVPAGNYIFEVDMCGSCLAPASGAPADQRTVACDVVPNVKMTLSQGGTVLSQDPNLTVPNDALWKHREVANITIGSGPVTFTLENNINDPNTVGNDLLLDNIKLTRVIDYQLAITPDVVVPDVDNGVCIDVWLEDDTGAEVPGTRRLVCATEGVDDQPFTFSAGDLTPGQYVVKTSNTTVTGDGGDTTISQVAVKTVLNC